MRSPLEYSQTRSLCGTYARIACHLSECAINVTLNTSIDSKASLGTKHHQNRKIHSIPQFHFGIIRHQFILQLINTPKILSATLF